MKKTLIFLTSVCLLVFSLVLFACGEPKTVTVTFIQEGQTSIVREIEYGGSLKVKDTPNPVQNAKTGYKMEWDRSDFKNITENIVVHAKEVAGTFNEILDYGYDGKTETVSFVFDEIYNLPIPERAGYSF
ncbi:MAG: hypothetical protein J6T42_03090, partial [Clostridia bacterium]|nr:hypothetical protein [Clostridia bacterium]